MQLAVSQRAARPVLGDVFHAIAPRRMLAQAAAARSRHAAVAARAVSDDRGADIRARAVDDWEIDKDEIFSATGHGISAWDCSLDCEESLYSCSIDEMEMCGVPDTWPLDEAEHAAPPSESNMPSAVSVDDFYFVGAHRIHADIRRDVAAATADMPLVSPVDEYKPAPILGSASFSRQNQPQEKTFNARVRQYLHAVQVGDIQVDMQQPSQAVSSYSQALELHTIAMAALFAKRAAAHSAAASDLDPSDSQPAWKSSLRDAQRALQLDPSLALAYLCVGEALLNLNPQRTAEAADVLRKGLDVEPENEILAGMLQRAEELIKPPSNQ